MPLAIAVPRGVLELTVDLHNRSSGEVVTKPTDPNICRNVRQAFRKLNLSSLSTKIKQLFAIDER